MSNSNPDLDTPDPIRGFILLRGIVIPLPLHGKFIFGRDKANCDIALLDQRVSKQHIMITSQDQKYVISDLDSMNGSYLNGERIMDSFTLMPGDEIKVAPFSMLFIGPDQIHPQSAEPEREVKGQFSGQLQSLKAVDLIQLINSTGHCGMLHLRDAKAKTAKLIFIRGEIVAAQYESARGEQAVYAALAIHEGEFDFVRGEQTVPVEPIQKKTQTLLFEGCQLKDENRIPGVTAEARKPSRKSTQPVSMPADFPK